MRWTEKRKEEGQVRIVDRFLWFPKKIEGESRWLEKAQYLQAYELIRSKNNPDKIKVWVDKKWIDR